MKRLLAILLGLAALGAAMSAMGASDEPSGDEYSVEFDNAFGLIEGGDLKIAGVRAGKITELELDKRSKRAVVKFRITEKGFGSLRADTRCEARPQSLIGEYFVDCLPGTSPTELKPGDRIPVAQTTSTVAPDLVNNILRRPYRERLSIILGELGAGVAGRGADLDAAIRRASPALRETTAVLRQLAAQDRVLGDLVKNGDRVIADLAGNKEDVTRFVAEARDTSRASAERSDAISEGFRRFPGFLRELRPTMAALGRTADAQRPALRNLRVSAEALQTLFARLAPFAQASRPAIRALGKASQTGSAAVKAAAPVVKQLSTFAAGTPELGGNLAQILTDLDDPTRYVEADPRAAQMTGRPMPTGYSGLEALLAYVYDQTLSTNLYDGSNHYLRVAVMQTPCADYRDASVKDDKALYEQCSAVLGPKSPGISFEDPTLAEGRPGEAAQARARAKRADGTPAPLPGQESTAPPSGTSADGAPAPSDRPTGPTIQVPQIPGAPEIPPIKLPGFGGGEDEDLLPGLKGGRGGTSAPTTTTSLLDYLVGK